MLNSYVELKIWRGSKCIEDGEKQIMGYLDYFGLTTGYMVSFPVFVLSARCAGPCSYRLSFGMVAVRLKASFPLTATIPQGLI